KGAGACRHIYVAEMDWVERWPTVVPLVADLATQDANAAMVDLALAEFGLLTFCLYGGGPASGLGAQEAAYGFHAGEVETALLLAATPELVQRDQYTVNYIARAGEEGVLRPEFAYATFAWLTRDIAPSGALGDPTPATAENGRRWCDEMSARIAAALQEMLAYEHPVRA
ncbi:MAG TPA: creatininase family protein, partial [Verrucomicrobiota bacterium]|nr:creatininase family protein [Verrucomicrobiota bacterium]